MVKETRSARRYDAPAYRIDPEKEGIADCSSEAGHRFPKTSANADATCRPTEFPVHKTSAAAYKAATRGKMPTTHPTTPNGVEQIQ